MERDRPIVTVKHTGEGGDITLFDRGLYRVVAIDTSEVVRQIERVAAAARVDEGRVRNCYDVPNVELGLATPVQRPTDMVPWVADGCDAPASVRRRALELAEVAEETGVANGCRPSGVAAACLYRAGDERGWPVSRAAVAEVANVTPVTVRTHDKALVSALED